MVHIAWLGKKSPFCGNVTYGNSTTKELKARGYKISFIHFDNPSSSNSSKPLFIANDPDVSLPYLIKSQVYTIPSPRAEKELRLSLERLKPDIVHASLTLSPLDFRLPELCNEINVPLIGTFHPPFDAKNRTLTASTQQLTYQLYAPSLAKFDKIIIFSEPQKNVLDKLGVPTEKQIVIPNGVDENIWKPFCEKSKKYDQVKNKLGNERIFIYMGRIANEKNVEALLRAWRQTKTNNCKLVIIGDGPMKPTLENSFSNLGKDKFNIELFIDNNYKIIKNNDNFLWIGRGHPYRWLVLCEINSNAVEDYKAEIINVFESNLTGMTIPPNFLNLSFERNVKVIRGLYEHFDSDTGGPFFTYIFDNNVNNSVILLSGFVNNPGKKKSNLLLQLETIINNIKVKKNE